MTRLIPVSLLTLPIVMVIALSAAAQDRELTLLPGYEPIPVPVPAPGIEALPRSEVFPRERPRRGGKEDLSIIVQKSAEEDFGKVACDCPQQRRVSYWNHRVHSHRAVSPCAPMVQSVLLVQAPECCHCTIEVPVCIPACCTDEPPEVVARRGLLGRTYLAYRWPSGVTIKVVIRCDGDVMVHYYGYP